MKFVKVDPSSVLVQLYPTLLQLQGSPVLQPGYCKLCWMRRIRLRGTGEGCRPALYNLHGDIKEIQFNHVGKKVEFLQSKNVTGLTKHSGFH